MKTRHAVLISIISFPLIFGARPAAAAPHSSPRSTSRPVATTVPEAAPRLLELVNRDRAAAGLVGLSIAPDASDIASEWTDRMAAAGEISHNQAYLSEESMRRLNASLVGENVAMAQSADQIHDMLMQSPPHRANILKPDFREIGFGATRVDGDLYVTQAFLTRQSESPRRSASGSDTSKPAPPANDVGPATSAAKAPRPAPAKATAPAKAPASTKSPRPTPAKATAPAKAPRPAPAPDVASPPRPAPGVPAEPAPPAEPTGLTPAAVSTPDPGPATGEYSDVALPAGYADAAGGEPTIADDDGLAAAADEQPTRPVDKRDMLTGAAAIGLLGTIGRRRR